MIYVLLCMTLLCSALNLYFNLRTPKVEKEVVRAKDEADITQEELDMYKAEADLAERKYSEGVLNVLNYDIDVAKKALRGG